MQAALPTMPTIAWTEGGTTHSALWRSERGAPPPTRVVIADDTTSADVAYRLACEGTSLLWRGDFHNARQLLQAMERRIDKTPERKKRRGNAGGNLHPSGSAAVIGVGAAAGVGNGAGEPVAVAAAAATDAFNRHRLAQSQRARILGAVLLPFDADYAIPLRRAPDARLACSEAWGPAQPEAGPSVATLRDLMGMTGAHEWRKKGVAIDALGPAPDNRIHPHYGVFSPVRGEYIDLVAQAPLPAVLMTGPKANSTQQDADTLPLQTAFDIGTGTGVLAAVLARRDVVHIVATDQDPRALACAQDNLTRLKVGKQVTLRKADLFPAGQAALIVCNPPWLPARPSSPVEHAVYDEGSRMLLGFLKGLAAHLADRGEGWLILSDLAEHLGLRSRATLLAAFADNGLRVLGRLDAKPQHRKATDATDPLHAARAAEVTSLWRLGALPAE